MIYDMAVDNYVKNSKIVLESSDGDASVSEESKESKKQLKTLNLTPIPPDPVVVHAGMVTTLLKILPSLYFEEWPDMSLSLQLFCAETIKSLLRWAKQGFLKNLMDLIILKFILGLRKTSRSCARWASCQTSSP